jgi:hypothetical protein
MTDLTYNQEMHEQASVPDVKPVHESHGPMPLSTLPVANQGTDTGTFKTIVLSSANPYRMALPEDNTRRVARIIAIDNPVVMCQSENQAQDPANQVTDVPQPNGGYIPTGLVVPVTCTSVLFLAATTTASVSRVFVSIERDADA